MNSSLRSRALVLMFALVASSSAAPLQQTPPERLLAQYLQAFNDREGAGLSAFLRESFELPSDRPEVLRDLLRVQTRLRKMSGGFDLRRIRSLGSAELVADVQNRRTGTWSQLSLFLAAEAPEYKTPTLPYRVAGLGISDAAAPEELLQRQRLSDAEIARRVGRLMETLVSSDEFCGTVLVARGGRPVFSRAYGLANRSYDVPNTMQTRFNLASMTKMFTAVAVAKLVEEGKLSYDDPVGKLLPEYPNSDVAKRVTVHHLLTHTAGLIGARQLLDKNAPAPRERTVEAMLPAFVGEPLSFAPGERFDYSNAGYILLGRIIEKVSGQEYFDFVRDRVFQRAGMTGALFLDLDEPTRHVASGYEDGPNGSRLDNIFSLPTMGLRGSPAGGAYATAGDMDRFGRALLSGRLIRPATLERMWERSPGSLAEEPQYRYGAYVQRYNGLRVVSHGGGWRGITNQFEIYPELGVTVTILGNTDSQPKAIAYKVREWLVQGWRPSEPKQ